MDVEVMWSFVYRGIIRAVGWSMAVVGFSLSVASPVVTTLIPSLRMKSPALITSSHVEEAQKNGTSRAKMDLPAEPKATDASYASSSFALVRPHSEKCSAYQDISSNHPEATGARPSPNGTRARAEQRHICCPKRCANRASSSSSSESSSLDLLNERNKLADEVLAAAPDSHFPILAHVALSPIVSEDGNEEAEQENVKERRRSWGMPSLKKLSKRPTTQTRSLVEASLNAQRCHSAPASRRSSFTMSPARTMSSLPDHDTSHISAEDFTECRRGKTKRPLFFRKFSSRSKDNQQCRKRDVVLDTPDTVEPIGVARSSSGHEHRSSGKFCHRPSRRHGTTPPPRTQPYEAPYFFPTPDSEDAVNYAERIRAEMRLSSSPPSTSKTFPDIKPPTISHTGEPHEQIIPLSHSATMPAQSAPPHRTKFSQKLFSSVRPSRHRKTSSAGSIQELGADEFGVATVASPNMESSHDRHVRLVPERAVSSPGPRVSSPLTRPSPPRPILKHSL